MSICIYIFGSYGDITIFLCLQKTSKVKDLRRAQKCIRKRKLKQVEEMEIVMALIDLKVVSRVLRMNDLSEEQLHWCEDKMTKVRVGDGKLQRDSSPLFFPAHWIFALVTRWWMCMHDLHGVWISYGSLFLIPLVRKRGWRLGESCGMT